MSMLGYKKTTDLTNPLTFTLTKKNVACAIRKDEKRCAWAEAISASVPGVDLVVVKNSVVYVAFADKTVRRGMLSTGMKNAVKAFDGDIPGKDFSDFCPPGDYQILVPPKSQTMKAMRNRLRRRRKSGEVLPSGRYANTGSHPARKVSARTQVARSSAERFREAQLSKG